MLVAGGWCWLGGCHSRDGPCQVAGAGGDVGWGAGGCSVLRSVFGLDVAPPVCGFEDLQVLPGALGWEAAGPWCAGGFASSFPC